MAPTRRADVRKGGGTGWRGGWWARAERRASPNHNARPRGAAVTLAIVHSISLPPGHYGGDAVAALFENTLDPDAHPYYERLRGLRVSAHFFVRRDGRVLQFVGVDRRAWHAGVSRWRGRRNCNDISLGVELEGLEGLSFERAQYAALARLLRAAARRWPLADVAGHEHVAPGRKQDPGAGFDWPLLARALRSARHGTMAPLRVIPRHHRRHLSALGAHALRRTGRSHTGHRGKPALRHYG